MINLKLGMLLYLNQFTVYAVSGAGAGGSFAGSRPTRGCWSAPDRHRQDADRRGGRVTRRCTPGRRSTHTTPLIALTDQKFQEMQAAAERWGFRTRRRRPGHRQPPRQSRRAGAGRRGRDSAQPAAAPRSVRLQPNVSAVVMDEFHSFADPERGIVWEFSLSLLPRHVRLLLLSATVGNAVEFLGWLKAATSGELELVQSTERKVPLLVPVGRRQAAQRTSGRDGRGDDEARRTPALVFCFNRDECWSVAEELKGEVHARRRPAEEAGRQAGQARLVARGRAQAEADPAARRRRASRGLLPRYRRIVEDLFQQKLLSVCVCTETLSAGINLPARSVVLPSLLKGPPGKQKIIDASSAHQIFGRAGRPQFDKQGYVYALPHEDDVRILRWKEKYDQIPEDTKDPGLIKAKKA